MTVLADPVGETRRIIEAADASGVTIRAVGGVGVALVAPTVTLLRPRRTYHDIDLVAPAGAARIIRLVTDLGYTPAKTFNALNGSERLLFHDADGRRIDVFLDTLRMCHELRLGERLAVAAWPLTLAPADLLLSKLQIVELTDRDGQDVLALLADHELSDGDGTGIDLRRMREVCDRDWGWWRTVDDNLARLVARWIEPLRPPESAPVGARSGATDRARELRDALASSPKTLAWKVRAAIGPRVRWYDVPEEVR